MIRASSVVIPGLPDAVYADLPDTLPKERIEVLADSATAPHERPHQLDQVTDTIHARFAAIAITRDTNLVAAERTAE